MARTLRETPARVAVFVSGGGTNLQALIDSKKNGLMPSVDIRLVLSNKEGAYAIKRAEENGIPAFAYPKKQMGLAAFEAQVLKKLREYDVELIVFAGFLSIVSANFISRYPGRIVNIHPSLIPAFCGKGMYGLKVHEAALERGVKLTGATVHVVNEIPDGGRILYQKAVRVQRGDTPETLQRRVMEQAEWILLPKAVEQLCKEIREGRKA